jgi:hypothetical protein
VVPKATPSRRLPCRVLPDLRLPADSWWPGQIPAQGGQVPRGGKTGHVSAGLGDDNLGGWPDRPGQGDQVLKLAGEGRISSSIRADNSKIDAESWSMRCAAG